MLGGSVLNFRYGISSGFIEARRQWLQRSETLEKSATLAMLEISTFCLLYCSLHGFANVLNVIVALVPHSGAFNSYSNTSFQRVEVDLLVLSYLFVFLRG